MKSSPVFQFQQGRMGRGLILGSDGYSICHFIEIENDLRKCNTSTFPPMVVLFDFSPHPSKGALVIKI